MEESFGLAWEDSTTVVQTEEVICGIENEILSAESVEFTGVPEEVAEEVVEATEEVIHSNAPIMYLDENMLVVNEQTGQFNQEHLMECQVTEEVITEQWGDTCAEEIVVGSEEAVDGTETAEGDCDIPLPTDQDEYTAARPYPCDFCSRRFRKKANLMNHMVAHQTDRPHGCSLCGVGYIRKCDLMNHLKIHAFIPENEALEDDELHAVDEFAQNDKRRKAKQVVKRRKKKIKEEFDQYEMEAEPSGSRGYTYEEHDDKMMDPITQDYDYEHQAKQSNELEHRFPITDPKKPFVCQHCGVGFAREKALLSHTRLHSEGESPFECQKCGEMFWDPVQMREHLKDKHGDLEDFDDDEDEDYSEEDNKYGTFYCSVCGLSFHRQDNLRRHQRLHVKEEYVNEHEFGHVCNVCGESFQEALDLLAHAEVHAGTVEFRCMICGENAIDESTLAVHVQSKHGKNLPPNTCMLCGRSCKDRRTLLKHSWEHSKEKVFACSKCAKTFHNKARLKRHMLSHRSKAVQCDVCGEEFPDGRSLMNHRHSHSSVSGGRQFPCRECGKTFGSRSSQQIHIRIHTGERPYGCRFCWKAFADGGTLRKHERIHTGEKPYACAVCPRAFNQRVVLREHIRSHHSGPDPKYTNSMTPYCCSVCSDLFSTSQDLILHLIHHCDMNTAMKRQPQIGPRKYKRRRKLKPHELEMISNKVEEDDNGHVEAYFQDMADTYTDSEEERERRKRYNKRQQKKASLAASPKDSLSESYTELYNSCSSAIESITTLVNSKAAAKQQLLSPKKPKLEHYQEAEPLSPVPHHSSQTAAPSRPKMIHTQKTRVAVETGEDGRVRHKTKTMVTRTQPAEIRSAIGERIRPRTKNVNYRVLQPDKHPLATFPEKDPLETVDAVEAFLKQEHVIVEPENITTEVVDSHNNGLIYMDQFEHSSEVACEQTVETVPDSPVVELRKTRSRSASGSAGVNSLKPGRHVIGPGGKVRLVKEGMIVSGARSIKSESESDAVDVASDPLPPAMKREPLPAIDDPSALHELAEISMQHATAHAHKLFKCEMCSAVFSDGAQLLVHVPVHI